MKLESHPTVQKIRNTPSTPTPHTVNAAELRSLCLRAGADDVGFVEIERAELAAERPYLERALQGTRTLISLVFRMNQEPIRTPERSVSNLEFHQTGDHTNEVCRRIVMELERRGIKAVNAAMGFPMEMARWSQDRTWVVAHKPVAVAAGLGAVGVHRNVIHPRFGSFILLGTVLMAATVETVDKPLDYNPCLECKLCVAACPTGAIHPDGQFDFSACYTHNYREFMSGFTDWVETVADSKSATDYRHRVSDAESVSMWQSLAFGPSYKAAYCLSVCPAGEDVLRPFLDDRKQFLQDVVRPLQDKVETVYVTAGSDAEAYVAKRFPHKRARRVHNGLRSGTISGFLDALPHVFQRGQSAGLSATYHFRFTGDETAEATVVIQNQTLTCSPGLSGSADLVVETDSRTWLAFLAGEVRAPVALLLRKIRLHGPLKLLVRFGRCFPR